MTFAQEMGDVLTVMEHLSATAIQAGWVMAFSVRMLTSVKSKIIIAAFTQIVSMYLEHTIATAKLGGQVMATTVQILMNAK